MNNAVSKVLPLPLSGRTALQAELLGTVGGDRAANLFTTVVRNEGLYETWIPFCLKLLFHSAFNDAEKEAVILRTAWRTGADYEWGHHLRIARKAGLSEQQIEAIATPTPQLHSEQSEHQHLELLVRATDELLDLHTNSPEVAEELAVAFTAEQRIELPMLVGHYSLLAMLLRSLDIPFDTFAKKKEAS